MAEARGEPSSFDEASDLPPFPDDGSAFGECRDSHAVTVSTAARRGQRRPAARPYSRKANSRPDLLSPLMRIH